MDTYLINLQDRVAQLEIRMADEHFKQLCSVTIRVAFEKLERSNREQVQRLEKIIQNGQDKMNTTIYKHRVTSKEQKASGLRTS